MKCTFIILAALLLGLSSCRQLPKERLSQWSQKVNYDVDQDTLRIEIDNSIHCPVRIVAKSQDEGIQAALDKDFPAILPPISDTTYSYWTDKSKDEVKITFTAMMGNPEEEIVTQKFNLPFKNGSEYEILQGYNGTFSHTSAYSKYSLDFNLQEGDTICAATDGIVVGVIEDYIHGGNSKKWRDYANFITIFHPSSNLFSQYVHIVHKGSFVEVGDSVKAEQPIGLSGKTGFTSGEHLHFNVLKPNDSGVESVPIEFHEGYIGRELKKGDRVKG